MKMLIPGKAPSKAVALLIWIAKLHGSFARHWTDVVSLHDLVPVDETFSKEEIAVEVDGLLFTSPPTEDPTLSPTVSPEPSISPGPTFQPTLEPTSEPTTTPTDTLFPSSSPTSAPTDDPFPYNAPPAFPQSEYFHYDPDSGYGPMNWANEWSPPFVNYYWNEFTDKGFGAWRGVLQERRLDRNSCGRDLQSPIDVKRSFNGTHFSQCRGFSHQILAKAGDINIDDNDLEKIIESNKLRLKYWRRPCFNLFRDACIEKEPSHGDFPNGWAGEADILHVDFKVPSEHFVNGVAYDAEMQIIHGHIPRKRLPSAAVVIRAIKGVHNSHLQKALDEFQKVFDQHAEDCDANKRRGRKLVAKMHRILGDTLSSLVDYSTWGMYSIPSDEPQKINTTNGRNLFVGSADWFPYHPRLAPSPYFYAYAGSLTEPPCTEIVNWRVIRRPMLISLEQLDQMKNLIFNHVDSYCRRTSVHYEESVARPVQPSNARSVVQCGKGAWLPDERYFPGGQGIDSYDLNLPLI